MNGLDHADIVVTHECNMCCPHCIDSLVNTSKDVVCIDDVRRFLDLLEPQAPGGMEILLLGGEPTVIGAHRIKEIAEEVRRHGFSPIMSTNGVLMGTIVDCIPSLDWVQVTIHSAKEAIGWRSFRDKVNLKLAGDRNLTMGRLNDFIRCTDDFGRRSVSMYFTPDWKNLCEDPLIWRKLDGMYWTQNGSYLYSFDDDSIRYKKCIPGVTNIADEPSVPKLYPNGNYNKTWCNEEMDPYLGEMA